MRKTLMVSAAALGLAFGAPAFAQTTTSTTMGTTMGTTGATPGAADSANMGTTAPAMPYHARPAHRAAAMNGQGAAGAQMAQGASVRPGHVPGVGDSEPSSTQASNINGANTRSVIAPRLPAPSAGANASPQQLLGVAQNALRRGKTGEAQEALERAETRALDRSTAQGNESTPAQGPLVQAIGQARRSLANHDVAQTQRDIQAAMSASSMAQNGGAGMSGSAGMAGGGMSSGGMSGAGAPGGAMSGGYVGQAPANSAYSGAAMAPGTNALATTGATNGNAIGATTGGPAQANGIPGTPNGISSQQGSNTGGGGGGSGGQSTR